MERIILSNISKQFHISAHKNHSLLAKILSITSGINPVKYIKVLSNINLRANSGEIVGIIGDNGSGKSTLLRIIAGIYVPDKGSIHIKGKIISLINLSLGFHERLTMEENIEICCSLFGLSRSDIKRKTKEIIQFSELDKFTDTKLYQFSNGMLQRLAFSIAINCNPDILLLDEVFEVGDIWFKKKCSKKINELVDNGTTVIFVSHDLKIIGKLCDKVIWLENGYIKKEGNSKSVLEAYLHKN